MTAKKADLEKVKAMQIENLRRQSGNPYGPASAAVDDRRARRERDRALGLVPFAAKLPGDLVRSLQTEAAARSVSIDDLAAQLLAKALAKKGE
jgi:hypothetical protein